MRDVLQANAPVDAEMHGGCVPKGPFADAALCVPSAQTETAPKSSQHALTWLHLPALSNGGPADLSPKSLARSSSDLFSTYPILYLPSACYSCV